VPIPRDDIFPDVIKTIDDAIDKIELELGGII
jgi:hypothetical protein